MIDADGVDDAVLLACYTFKAANPFPAVTEGTDTLDSVRAIEGGRDEVPYGVRRPGFIGWREHVHLIASGAKLGDEALPVGKYLLVDRLCISKTVSEGVCLGVLNDDGGWWGRVLRGEEKERREESEGGEERVARMPLEDGRHGEGKERRQQRQRRRQ